MKISFILGFVVGGIVVAYFMNEKYGNKGSIINSTVNGIRNNIYCFLKDHGVSEVECKRISTLLTEREVQSTTSTIENFNGITDRHEFI